MEFSVFFKKCQTEPTVSDFESYLAHCIFEKPASGEQCTLEAYAYARDRAFEQRDEKAARFLYDLSQAKTWEEGEWEGALR